MQSCAHIHGPTETLGQYEQKKFFFLRAKPSPDLENQDQKMIGYLAEKIFSPPTCFATKPQNQPVKNGVIQA